MPNTMKTPLSYETEVYIDTTPTGGSATYAEINKGFTSFSKSNNPNVQSQQYIGDINATTQITSLGMQFAYSGERVVGDVANDFFADLDGKVGNDLKSTIVKVNLWEAEDDTAIPATLYNVVIAVGSDGDLSGGATQAISGTVYVNGDPVKGTFNRSTKAFSPSV